LSVAKQSLGFRFILMRELPQLIFRLLVIVFWALIRRQYVQVAGVEGDCLARQSDGAFDVALWHAVDFGSFGKIEHDEVKSLWFSGDRRPANHEAIAGLNFRRSNLASPVHGTVARRLAAFFRDEANDLPAIGTGAAENRYRRFICRRCFRR